MHCPELDLWMPLPSLTNGGSLDARSDPPRKSTSWTFAKSSKHPKPGAVDPKGLTFTTERRVKKEGGKHGFADAWKKGFFGWEYKKKGGDLNEAYNQLLQYSGDLGNPPLLVVSDMDRIEIRTRFTDYPTTNYVITLDTFATPGNLEKFRCLFYEPERLRPEKTIEKITEEAAKTLAELAPTMRDRLTDSTKVAHFLDRLIFCMFAESVGLLPNHVFSQFLNKTNRDPRFVNRDITQLFEAMAKGGDFYGETIPHFNGNLFDNTPPLDLLGTELPILIEASAFDWSEMDPSIFGTLFERVMDPAQRSQLGAHYTGYRDIATLVEPVIMAPLRREWTEALEKIASLVPDVIETRKGESLFRPADESRIQEAQKLVDAFLERLRAIRVLDPACGSGNFLYVTLRHAERPGKRDPCGVSAPWVEGIRADGRAESTLWDRDQSLRLRPGTNDGLDRVHPVAEGQRLSHRA